MLCILYKNYIFFHNHLELTYKSFYLRVTSLNIIPFHHYFHYILQLIYLLTFFYTYSLYNLIILQNHMIYHILIHNCRIPIKSFITYSFVNQFFTVTSAFIRLSSLSVFFYYYKHLHLVYIYTYKFHANLCILFLKFLKLD